MRLYKWELKKLVSAPAVWVFLALCAAFNILIIAENSYESAWANEISREIARTGERRYTDREDIFMGYDTSYLADVFVKAFRLRGGSEALMRGKYERLQAVVRRNAEAAVSLDIYADGATYEAHRSLFRKTLFPIFTESILFAVLSALYTLGYEHQQKTEPLVYGTRTGRAVTRHKRAAALTAAACGFALLAALTLAVHFAVWDFSGLWNSNVSGMMNYVIDEPGTRPFITWANLNVAQYLAAVLALGFALTVVFSLIGSVTGLLTGNTYYGFMVVFLLCALLLTSVFFFAEAGLGWGMMVSTFTPVAAWFSSRIWLTDMGGWGFIPFHETTVVLGSLALLSIIVMLASRRFLRKDVL